MILEAIEIQKSYGKMPVLAGASLKVAPGMCVGVVGGNGCGKTTLLSILAGAVRPDRGRILLAGQEVLGRSKGLSDHIAYVPQENPLMEELTVKDNLRLWYRGDKAKMEADLKQGAAFMLGIPGMLGRTAGTLSGGMKKRLSIACALSNHGEILILDEPGAALDLECKEAIRSYLKRFLAEGGSVVLTSHEMEELSLCTAMYVLKEGRMVPAAPGLSESELIRLF